MSSRALNTINRRWDAVAIGQLREEVSRLSAENEELRNQLERAEQIADAWARDASELHLQLCEAHLGAPGITQDGKLVVVPAEVRA